jgi:hypothetical protein
MKVGITRLIIVAAIAALVLVAGSTAAWAQSCPTSPKYSPDFTSNQPCLTLNGTRFNTPNTAYPSFVTTNPTPTVATVLRLTPNQGDWAGSAWFTTQQPVAGAFSTTFTFQLSGATTFLCGETPCPADGIAFVVQNSALTALGPEGCGIGFGDSSSGCTPPTGGIPNSLAVEFNTFANSGDPSSNFVAIQTCLTGPNTIDPGTCRIAINSTLPSTMADGNVHTVTINYSGAGTKLLDVILDNTDLFPGGVVFDLTTIGLNSGNAWVGFTAATGGADDNQDILSWTFTPGSQTAVISQTAPTVLTFPNAAGTNVYDYNAQLTAPYATPVITVQPILMTSAACNALVQKNFWPARCFVYQNAENSGLDAAVMFAVTCPTSPGGTCGTNVNQNFFSSLGTDFEFSLSDNPFFTYPGVFGLLNPFPGWLKGSGPDPLNPCTPPASGPLFQSNQINAFSVVGDPGGKTVGGSGGTGSCWVATYDTPGEIWPGIKITSPKVTTYTLNQVVPAVYACNNPFTSKPPTNPTGPYLTAASCTQSSGTQTSCTQTSSGLSCTGTVDTSSKGLHTFLVTAIDRGGNQNLQVVVYKVK